MIAHPDESPQHFTRSEGTLVLIDQNRHEIDLLDKPELKVYLEAHGISNVAYQAGAEEGEVLGIGIGWRTWLVNDVFRNACDLSGFGVC